MDKETIKRLFPNASASLIQANLQDYGQAHTDTGLPTTKPAQPAPALGAADEGKAQSTRRPHVCFTLCRVKLLDWDAKYGVLKDLLDGLVIANLLPGDREDQITGECKQVRVSSYKNEKTIIEITL